MHVLATGASGFVGRALLARFGGDARFEVTGASRRSGLPVAPNTRAVRAPELDASSDWLPLLRGVDVVVHLAARVHVMRDRSAEPLAEFRRVNVDGTLRLARDAARAGVRRLVFVSSIKVNGESTRPGRPFAASDAPRPADAYGRSKHEAERELAALARESGIEVVVVRPVLVYGPGVRANFRGMLRAIALGLPLPFGRVDNRRSLIAAANLADLLAVAAWHPLAAGQTFLASDGEDLSTPELLRRTARALGRRARLLSIPVAALRTAGRLAGREAAVRRLCDSLQVDVCPTCDQLGWRQPVSVDAALRETAADYLARVRR